MPDIAKSRSSISFLQLAADGSVSLRGSRCKACGDVTQGMRTVCPACGSRGQMDAIQLGEQGRLYSYTIVHRSFPGVKTPFIAAIVELDGGGVIKGTLLDVAPDPSAIAYDMAVDVVYRDTGQIDSEGRSFISYYFVPSEQVAS